MARNTATNAVLAHSAELVGLARMLERIASEQAARADKADWGDVGTLADLVEVISGRLAGLAPYTADTEAASVENVRRAAVAAFES